MISEKIDLTGSSTEGMRTEGLDIELWRSSKERPGSNCLSVSLKIEWLYSKEAAEYLRISVKSLRNMASNGQIPFYKLGRRNRYRKDELEAILLSQKRGE